MPITEAERKKLKNHTFSEDKKDEFRWTHGVVPEFDIGDTLSNSLGMIFSSPYPWIANIAGSLILAVYVFEIFGHLASLQDLLIYTILFFILEIIVASPLSAFSKAKFAKIESGSVARPMLMSLTYLSPLVPILYLAVLISAFHYFISLPVIGIFVSLIVLILAVILHIANLNVSLATDAMYDKKTDRNTALSRSWMMISGSSLSMLLVNILVFLPLILATSAEFVFRSNSAMAMYILPVIFVASEFCLSWWHASVSYSYGAISKNIKPMQYSRL